MFDLKWILNLYDKIDDPLDDPSGISNSNSIMCINVGDVVNLQMLTNIN